MRRAIRIRLIALGAALLTVLGLGTFLGLRREKAVETASWGLSFQTEGDCPVGSATKEELAAFDAAYAGSGEEKVIWLTFDAGYDNGNTAPILDALQKHGAPAAFFVVGSFIEKHPDLVRRMAAEGHIVGNHTWSHPDMSQIADEDSFASELRRVEEAYKAVTGEELPRYYRPPRGIYSEDNLRLAKKLGYRTVFWSLAYVDWLQDDQPSAEQAFSKLIGRIHPGAVVLLHSTSSTNAEILDELLTRWEEMGYRFAGLEELFAP